MACYHPLNGYYHPTLETENGKKKIVFYSAFDKKPEGVELVRVPCGQCIGCRVSRSKSWALRCYHEAQGYEKNCFITLSYRPECLPPYGSLKPEDFTLFLKRFRKRFSGNEKVVYEDGTVCWPIRYFACGEYGDQYHRPHYHACIFNYDFPDKYFWKKSSSGEDLFRDDTLEELWSKEVPQKDLWKYPADAMFERHNKIYVNLGHCTIGEVNHMTAAYVARYVLKKRNGDQAHETYVRDIDVETGEIDMIEPEYCVMSKKPGIGNRWFEEYGYTDCMSKDFCIINGKKFAVPKYYDRLFEFADPHGMEDVKVNRKEHYERLAENYTPERLRAGEIIQKQRLKRLTRSYENEVASV